MANAGLGIVIALGIGIAATLALLFDRPSEQQTHEYRERPERSRDYNQPNAWSQTPNRRITRQKSRKSNGAATKKKESACAICMMTEGYEEFISLPCSHEFHKLCIISWKKESPTCPICRSHF